MASMLEEVTAHYAAMVGVAAIETVTFAVSEAVTFAVFEPITVFAFVAVVQVSIAAFLIVDRSALGSLVSTAELTGRTTVTKVRWS